MSWESRQNERRYFYRVVRVDGQVKRHYYGFGRRAEAEAARLEAAKAARVADNERVAALGFELEPLATADTQLAAGVEGLVEASLLCEGLHKRRGQWRKCMDAETEKHEANLPKPAVSSLEATLELARRGNRQILPQLRTMLDKNLELYKRYGDLAAISAEAWLSRIAGSNLLVLEAARREAQDMKAKLEGDHPTVLERLVVDRVVAAWLASMCADIAAASETSIGKVATFLMKRAEAAHRQFFNASRSLALIRRLLTPAARPVTIVQQEAAIAPGAGCRLRPAVSDTMARAANHSGGRSEAFCATN